MLHPPEILRNHQHRERSHRFVEHWQIVLPRSSQRFDTPTKRIFVERTAQKNCPESLTQARHPRHRSHCPILQHLHQEQNDSSSSTHIGPTYSKTWIVLRFTKPRPIFHDLLVQIVATLWLPAIRGVAGIDLL